MLLTLRTDPLGDAATAALNAATALEEEEGAAVVPVGFVGDTGGRPDAEPVFETRGVAAPDWEARARSAAMATEEVEELRGTWVAAAPRAESGSAAEFALP